MAEVVVGRVVDKLAGLLFNEAKLFKGVHKDVESLRKELESIKFFLKDAEARAAREATKEGVKFWVRQVRDEANRIEDVVDEYIRHVSPQCDHSGFLGFLHKLRRVINKFKQRYKIASEVHDIKTSLREIKERSDRYRFQSSSLNGKIAGHVEEHDPRFDSIFIEEEEVLGVDLRLDELKSALIEGESSRVVVALVGTGGIGKTTIANQVYENEVVKKHFECRAWITVSQSYNMKKLLENMTKQICIDSGHSKGKGDNVEELIKCLKQFLMTQRYIVVFDDVWDEVFWKNIKYALPRNDKRSRVIVTTRNSKIASAACQERLCDNVIKIDPLSGDTAWNLFCKKAFGSKHFEPNCPKELEDLSREIVVRCQGLPLVITAIACLMEHKEKTVQEWKRTLDNISYEFESNSQLASIIKILSLSYDDLPHHLKPCFLYFGIFPEDYLLSEARLYSLWIAEGFVQAQRDDKTLEDVAKEYLDELIHRNLVEVSHLECNRYFKMCKVHDMMREVILSKFEDFGFCQILDKKKTNFKMKYRRFSINGTVKNVQGLVKDSTVRSIFLFNIDGLTPSFVVSLLKKFKLLRVLMFNNAPLEFLPEEVGNLFHLKYLGLQKTNVKVLPKTLGKLQNLQTLDLLDTVIKEVPFEIRNLPNMRHYVSQYWDRNVKFCQNSINGLKIPRGIDTWKDLQTLDTLDAFEDLVAINELEKLTNLRLFSASKLTPGTSRALCASISKMPRLRLLSLSSIRDDVILDVESVSSPPVLLQFLRLFGPLIKLPHWISQLQNLLELRLSYSNLQDDPLRFINSLPNLQRLFLNKAYDRGPLHFREGGFAKLKVLVLLHLVWSEAVVIDRGSLPDLEVLMIGDSPLKHLPTGIEHLANVKTLRFVNMSNDFVSTIRPQGGLDYPKVMHIASITLWKACRDYFQVTKLRDSDAFNVCCTKNSR